LITQSSSTKLGNSEVIIDKLQPTENKSYGSLHETKGIKITTMITTYDRSI